MVPMPVSSSLYSVLLFLCLTANGERYQRLILPSSRSELTIIPRIEMPMAMSTSVQSGMNLKLPITLRFPTFMDIMQPIRAALNMANVVDQVVVGSGAGPDPGTREQPLKVSLPIKTRINSRAKFYKAIETSHSGYGKVCLMRAICEVAEVPFLSASTGLIGELLDLLLTSLHLPNVFDALSDYKKAELFGRKSRGSGDKCKARYKGCPFSLFNVINVAINN